MNKGIYENVKRRKNFKKISDEFGLPQNRAIEKNFKSIIKIIMTLKD